MSESWLEIISSILLALVALASMHSGPLWLTFLLGVVLILEGWSRVSADGKRAKLAIVAGAGAVIPFVFGGLWWVAVPLLLCITLAAARLWSGDGAGTDDAPDLPPELVDAQERYVEGDLDEAALEREVEVLLDPRRRRIRERVESITGIGPATSRRLALAFDGLGDLRRADREDLEAVHDVGPSTAEAILEDLADPGPVESADRERDPEVAIAG